jgi:Ser/Thr protein kinase RdoA (MazF antagonist)
MSNQPQPFDELRPETICDVIDELGLRADGRLLALNSFENRVYRVGLDDQPALIAKFYRQGRWSDEQILEEHSFCAEMAKAELPVVAPIRLHDTTLHHLAGFRLALYPLCPGREPDLENRDNQAWLGRTLARMHQLGRRSRFQHRGRLSAAVIFERARRLIADGQQLPDYLLDRYHEQLNRLEARINERFEAVQPQWLRCHGDCHRGNVLWGEHGPHFVDLDDAISAPAIQDLWMLVPSVDAEPKQALAGFLEGYEQFQEFDRGEFALIEPLRALRMVNHQAWVAERWSDPAFPRAFPGFAEPRHWENHVQDLGEQLARLEQGL